MAVGFPVKANYATGDVLTATNMNDLSGSVNLLQSAQSAAGKNAIINGAFNVWQRGTSFTPAASSYVFTADRFGVSRDGTGATVTVSRQAFTPGTAPVSGYESQYFFRYAQTVAGTTGTYLTVCSQKIENVQNYANQTVTYSFWAKADTARTVTVGYAQIFGSGGSGDVYGTLGSSITLTASWVRYSVTGTIPSISGKTVGTSSYLELYIGGAQNTAQTIDLWGIQLEEASSASDFQTATGTIQGELAACQRYYVRWGGSGVYEFIGIGAAATTTIASIQINLPVQMRTVPGAVDYSTVATIDATGTVTSAVPTIVSIFSGNKVVGIDATVASGLTIHRFYRLCTNNSTSGYLGLSAEL
jgi:hypothetical protein